MKKVENFIENLFLENTLYIWKYFVLNIRAHSSCTPNCFALLRLCSVLLCTVYCFAIYVLFCSLMALAICLLISIHVRLQNLLHLLENKFDR